MLGTRASCEFDSVLRLLYPSLPPRPLDKIDLLSSIDRARVARLDRARSSSTAAATTASASASAAVGDDAVQHMYEQMGRTLLAPKGQTAYDHLESEAVTGVPQRSAQVPPKGVAKLRGIAKGCNCSAWSALRPCSSCSYRPNVPPRPARCNPRVRGCNPTCQRLQSHVPEAATPRARDCNPMRPTCNPYATPRSPSPHRSASRPQRCCWSASALPLQAPCCPLTLPPRGCASACGEDA